MDPSVSPTTKPLFRGVQVVRFLFGLLELILLFRLVLRFAGANPAAVFSNFIYTISYPFVAPFIAVFRPTVVQGSVFEWTTLLAIVVYAIIEWLIVHLFVMSRDVSTPEAAAKLEKEDS